ncbi:hypothetical protein P7C73_g5611, partial [Tremellales sp. Uapishka_1]
MASRWSKAAITLTICRPTARSSPASTTARNSPFKARAPNHPTPPRPSFSRGYTSSTTTSSPTQGVDLAFDVVQPASITAAGQSLVICHGLFGSKQNWRSLSKMFAQQLGMPVYSLDLRNHGHSPHVEPHTYEAMALDISRFLKSQGLESGVNLLGHSMGGKSVMALALNENLNGPLRSLISVDMSPARGKISPEFASYCEGMLEVDQAHVSSKAQADEILKKYEPVLATRQFLLTNTMTANQHLKFRIPLTLLSRSIPHIGEFPYNPTSPSHPTWSGPTLFLKGEHSRYLNKHNIPVAKTFFPEMQLEVLDTGHWVHAERPKETVELVKKFVEAVGR